LSTFSAKKGPAPPVGQGSGPKSPVPAFKPILDEVSGFNVQWWLVFIVVGIIGITIILLANFSRRPQHRDIVIEEEEDELELAEIPLAPPVSVMKYVASLFNF
jgi:hypothetical protein